MGDPASRLSTQEMADLSALADGTLPPERRAAVEARVAASPELRRLLDRQRRAVSATRAMASEPVPAALRTAVEGWAPGSDTGHSRARRLVPRFALGAAAAATAAIVLALVLSGGTAGPTVAEAAGLAVKPPSGPAPGRLDDSQAKLAARVDGVVFPDLRRSYGWRPVGVRHDRVGGREARVVYYAKGGKRIGYVILAGSGVPAPSGARATQQRGVTFRTLDVSGRPVVTWQRLGHTCVLTGSASRSELLALASWRAGGTLRY
jgi:anti-sigma factor RsiW